jgi:hypothetical protein
LYNAGRRYILALYTNIIKIPQNGQNAYNPKYKHGSTLTRIQAISWEFACNFMREPAYIYKNGIYIKKY